MYTEKALAIRRCKAIKADGTPCKSFAVWGKENQLCASHQPSKKIHKPRNPNRKNGGFMKNNRPPCACKAYPYPHRPGGGKCQWPDLTDETNKPDELEIFDDAGNEVDCCGEV